MVVIKMRGGNHSKDIREYVITDKGVVVIHPRRTDYNGLITGIPERAGPRKPPLPPSAWQFRHCLFCNTSAPCLSRGVRPSRYLNGVASALHAAILGDHGE